MKKIKFGKLKGKKVEALIGLVFFVGLVAVGVAVFTGGSISEVPQLIDTVPVSPSDLPSDVAPVGADPGPQDDSGVSGSESAFIVKKYYSNDYPTETTASVQAATETEIYDQPSTDVPFGPVSDDEDESTDPDEESVDLGDIEEVNDTDVSDEEPVPDDDESVDDDDSQDDDNSGSGTVTEEPDEEDIDSGDVEPVNDEEAIPDDLPSNEDLDDWLNS